MKSTQQKLYNQTFKTQLESGCKEAYTILYLDLKKNLPGIITSITKNPEITNDVIQETFLMVAKKIENLNNIESIRYWTMRISVNKAIDYIKNQNKVIYSESKLKITIQKSKVNDFLRQKSSSKNLIPQIDVILKRLSPKQRRIIVLKYFQNLKETEISNKLNVPLGTVKSRLYNSKKKLHQIIHATAF